jgi:hypothetical protein
MVKNFTSEKNTQTPRSLAHKLGQHPIWRDATKGFYEEDIEGCIYSWLSMSEDNKKERLNISEFYNFYEYFHNIIAKIEANMI